MTDADLLLVCAKLARTNRNPTIANDDVISAVKAAHGVDLELGDLRYFQHRHGSVFMMGGFGNVKFLPGAIEQLLGDGSETSEDDQ